MDYRVIVEQRARRDIDGTFAYIEQQSPAAAYGWYASLYGHIASLGDMPRRCTVVPEPDLAELGVRHLIFGRYRILFTVNEDARSVHIHHVHHAARRSAEPGGFRL